MAQLKDTVVSGNLRVTDSTITDTMQTKIIKAPTSSGGTTYGPGSNGQVLKSNGTSTYWGPDESKTYTAQTDSVGSASAGTAISADDITAWDAGSTPTLGTAIAVKSVKSWTAGSAPTLGTAIAADDITAWDAGSLPTAVVTGENLTLNFGSLPSLSYTARSIPNVTSAGTAASLTTEDKSIPNVTSVGSVPSLSYTSRTIPNISVTSKTVVTGITES